MGNLAGRNLKSIKKSFEIVKNFFIITQNQIAPLKRFAIYCRKTKAQENEEQEPKWSIV